MCSPMASSQVPWCAPTCRHGHRLVMNGPLVTRLLRAAVSFLDEGAQEARTSGKRILWEVSRPGLHLQSPGCRGRRRAAVVTQVVGGCPSMGSLAWLGWEQ